MSYNISNIERKIARLEKQLSTYNLDSIDKPQDVYSYFGGIDIGVIKGKIQVLEDLLDYLTEKEE